MAAKYAKGKIGNDLVCLRSYKLLRFNGNEVGLDEQELQFVGPTLKVKPGDLLKINIVNNLNDNDCNEKAATKGFCLAANSLSV